MQNKYIIIIILIFVPMGFLNKIFSKKSVNQTPIIATENQTEAFLRTLIGDLTNNYNIDSNINRLNAYNTVSQLNTVISSSAKAFVRAKKEIYDFKNNNKVLDTTSSLYNLLKKPHFLQSENEFWQTVYINLNVFGNAYIYCKKSTGFGYTSMFCMATQEVEVILKENTDYLKSKKASDIINKYLVAKNDNIYYNITDVDSVWVLQKTSLQNKNGQFAIGDNPLKPVEEEIATLKIIADIKKELLSNHGAIGIISPDGKDSGGVIPLLPKDKEELQKEYLNYGIQKGKNKLLITNQSVKFTAISLKIAELQLTEFENEASRTLANYFQFPVSLLTSDSKYSNQDSGNKELYENKIIPESKFYEDGVNDFFDTKTLNKKISFNFEDIVFLQTGKKELAERNKINSEIIISYNKSVSLKEISRESAIYALTLQGMSESDADKLISK